MRQEGDTKPEFKRLIDIILDVLQAAVPTNTWLTLAELRALTRYPEASISAQIRNLRKLGYGEHRIARRWIGAAFAYQLQDLGAVPENTKSLDASA